MGIGFFIFHRSKLTMATFVYVTKKVCTLIGKQSDERCKGGMSAIPICPSFYGSTARNRMSGVGVDDTALAGFGYVRDGRRTGRSLTNDTSTD